MAQTATNYLEEYSLTTSVHTRYSHFTDFVPCSTVFEIIRRSQSFLLRTQTLLFHGFCIFCRTKTPAASFYFSGKFSKIPGKDFVRKTPINKQNTIELHVWQHILQMQRSETQAGSTKPVSMVEKRKNLRRKVSRCDILQSSRPQYMRMNV